MHEIYTTIDVDAPAAVLWEVLTDFEAYPEWNRRTVVTGEVVEGARLRVEPGPDAGNLPTFEPRIVRVDPEERLVWRGSLYVGGLFDGEHRFEVDDLGDGRSRFVQSERFSGLLVRPLLWRYGDVTEEGFEAFNAGLKTRAEALAAERGTDVETAA